VAEIRVRVQCTSTEPNLSPVRFELGKQDLFVKEILDHWWGDGTTYFKVLADDDKRYILKHKAAGNLWTLDSLAPRK
jgi:hypothetical protein